MMRRIPPRAACSLATLLLAGLLLVTPARAGDEDAPDASKHLRYQRSYATALLEARIRNLPVLVTRHKDF